MPAYNSRTVALALGLELKELDNLLSRYSVRGVSGGIPGRNRRITSDAITIIAIAAELKSVFGSPWHQALEMADMLVAAKTVGLADGLFTLSANVAGYQERLNQRLYEVSEFLVTPARGRPSLSRSSHRRGDGLAEAEF